MKKETTFTILKVGVAVLGAGVTLAKGYFDKKDLDDTVAKKVAEALADKAGES